MRAGRARSTRSPTGCCACTPTRSASTRRSPCSIASDAADLIDLAAQRARAARATATPLPARRTPAWRSTRARSTRGAARRRAAGRRSRGAANGTSQLRALFARLRRGQAGAPRARLRRPAALLVAPDAGAGAGASGSAPRFDHVLVDEYQDTNALQAEILRALKPDGRGLTVVGDDAQAIYSFRAATVRQHPRLPERCSRRRRSVITLEQQLPLDPADPRRGQRGHRAGAANGFAQAALLSARGRRQKPRARHASRTSWRRSTTSSSACSSTREAGVALQATGGAVARRAPLATRSRSSSAGATSRS